MGIKLFISPHPDDECLFGAYTIQRELPIVAVFRDMSALYRNDESRAAMTHLGLPFPNLIFVDSFNQLPASADVETVWAPAMQHGHAFHDEVCERAILKYGPKVIFYSTYAKDKDKPPLGRFKVESTERMRKRKVEALVYYESQHRIAAIHFTRKCKDEYYF